MPYLHQSRSQKANIFILFFTFSFIILRLGVLDMKTNFSYPSSLLLSLRFFHPPSTGECLSLRFLAKVRASVVEIPSIEVRSWMVAAGMRGYWKKSKGTGGKKWLAIIGPLLLLSLHGPLKKTNRSRHSNKEPKPGCGVSPAPSSPAKVRGSR